VEERRWIVRIRRLERRCREYVEKERTEESGEMNERRSNTIGV
jgi:hypothetical protein